MAVLTTQRAFQLGYLPPLAGVGYNTLAFLEGAQRQPHLRERAALRAAAQRSGDGNAAPAEATDKSAADNPGDPADPIGQVEALLRSAGLCETPRPRDLNTYTTWAQHIQREVRTTLADDVVGLSCYNLGALLGDLALTLGLLALIHELRPRPDEEPPWLSAQRRGLLADVERGRVRLALLCRAPQGTLPAEVAEEATRCLRHLDADISTATAAATLQRQIAQRVSAILAAFPKGRGR